MNNSKQVNKIIKEINSSPLSKNSKKNKEFLLMNNAIELFPANEQMNSKAFIDYFNWINNNTDTGKDAIISAIAPDVIQLILQEEGHTVSIDNLTNKYRQRLGDYNVWLIENGYTQDNSYIELKSGGVYNDGHLILCNDCYFITLDKQGIYRQENSYKDHLGNLTHQVANAMLVYFKKIDIFAFIKDARILLDEAYNKLYSSIEGLKSFIDRTNGACLLGKELENNINKWNEYLSKHKNQWYNYRLVSDKLLKHTLSMGLFLDVLMNSNLFNCSNNIKLYKIAKD